MTRVHEELKSVLDQLEAMDAGVVKFNVHDLSEPLAEKWLKSESRRLEHLSRLMAEQHSS